MKRLATLALTLSLLLSLVGCGSGDTQAPAVQQPSAPTQQTVPPAQPVAPTQAKPKVELPELLDTISEPLTLAPGQADAFYAFLAEQQPEYELFDLYDFETALTYWEQITDHTSVGPGILQNGSLDRETFLHRLQQNQTCRRK